MRGEQCRAMRLLAAYHEIGFGGGKWLPPITSRWPDGVLFRLSLERQPIPREQDHGQNDGSRRLQPCLAHQTQQRSYCRRRVMGDDFKLADSFADAGMK